MLQFLVAINIGYMGDIRNMDKFRWETLCTRLVGTFRLKNVKLPTGRFVDYLVVSYPEAVGVLALTEDQQVVMIGQYRYAIDEYCWEIPAGSREKGESIVKCAKWELKEETSYSARHVKPFLLFISSMLPVTRLSICVWLPI